MRVAAEALGASLVGHGCEAPGCRRGLRAGEVRAGVAKRYRVVTWDAAARARRATQGLGDGGQRQPVHPEGSGRRLEDLRQRALALLRPRDAPTGDRPLMGRAPASSLSSSASSWRRIHGGSGRRPRSAGKDTPMRAARAREDAEKTQKRQQTQSTDNHPRPAGLFAYGVAIPDALRGTRARPRGGLRSSPASGYARPNTSLLRPGTLLRPRHSRRPQRMFMESARRTTTYMDPRSGARLGSQGVSGWQAVSAWLRADR